MGEFNDKVYETVRRVPRGKVVSYGQVARLIGQPRKARFVGYAMHGNPESVGLRGSDGDSLSPRGVQGRFACAGFCIWRA